jgi:hypothetical protein
MASRAECRQELSQPLFTFAGQLLERESLFLLCEKPNLHGRGPCNVLLAHTGASAPPHHQGTVCADPPWTHDARGLHDASMVPSAAAFWGADRWGRPKRAPAVGNGCIGSWLREHGAREDLARAVRVEVTLEHSQPAAEILLALSPSTSDGVWISVPRLVLISIAPDTPFISARSQCGDHRTRPSDAPSFILAIDSALIMWRVVGQCSEMMSDWSRPRRW